VETRSVEEVQPPKGKGHEAEYVVEGIVGAYDVLGFDLPVPEERKGFVPQGLDTGSRTNREFRLADGRHALGVYDATYCYSLVLVYRPPKGKGRIALHTKDRSLEAWLSRHAPVADAERYVPLKAWKDLLRTPGCVAEPAKAFRLEGQATVRASRRSDIEGLSWYLDLRSLKPLPPALDWLNKAEKDSKAEYEAELKKGAIPAKEINESYRTTLAVSAYMRSHKATECATIRGILTAGWLTPPRFTLPIFWP
jgi:hypothetical protein